MEGPYSKEILKWYVKNQAARCPNPDCLGDEVELYDPHNEYSREDTTTVERDLYCKICGANWTEVFKLTEIRRF